MRYLLYPFALTLLLTAAITGALLIGRAQPLQDRVSVLHLNDMCRLPCWIGITPGVTTLAEAEIQIHYVYDKLRKGWNLIQETDTRFYLTDANNDLIFGISIGLDKNDAKVNDVFLDMMQDKKTPSYKVLTDSVVVSNFLMCAFYSGHTMIHIEPRSADMEINGQKHCYAFMVFDN